MCRWVSLRIRSLAFEFQTLMSPGDSEPEVIQEMLNILKQRLGSEDLELRQIASIRQPIDERRCELVRQIVPWVILADDAEEFQVRQY